MGLRSGFLSLWNILRVNPLDPWKPHHIGQHILFFLYIAFIYAPLIFIISSSYSITGRGTMKISKSMWRYRISGFLVNCLIIVRLVILPWYLTGTPQLLNTNWILIGYGFHNAFLHLVHMFEGVRYPTDTEQPEKRAHFLYRHIATTSSSGGDVLCLIYGGLYQHIEHHLFPRINHIHFLKMRPIIKKFCAERGIPYNYFPTWFDLLKSSLKHLYILGHHEVYSTTDNRPHRC